MLLNIRYNTSEHQRLDIFDQIVFTEGITGPKYFSFVLVALSVYNVCENRAVETTVE